MPEIEVVQVRSTIGTKPKHRATLRALGLRGIGKVNVLPDRPEIRGMITRVSHLVSVRPVESRSAGSGPAETRPVEEKPVAGGSDEAP